MEKRPQHHSGILKFAITGPESTGKSTLSKQLAEHFQTTWVPEFARNYLQQLPRQYREDDLLKIAIGQKELEESQALHAQQLLFCDTENIVLKIWSNVRYNHCHANILQCIELQQYIHYFLCDIDIPWVEDPLREHPHMRQDLFNMYVDELSFYNFPFTVISGDEKTRLKIAIDIVNGILNR